MLALVAAFAFIVIAILIFAVGYLRLIGTKSEQKTAIEAAALAAARDMSRIVIDTPQFGFVGLSDSAPIGPNTTANDQYYTQVQSINTIIGTARLDAIIADKMNVPEWRILAKQDIDAAKLAAADLETALKDAIKPGGSGKDIQGQDVKPYDSAEQAYQQNQIRMSGNSNYVAGSLQLSLGGLANGSQTNVDVPNPSGVDGSLTSTNTVGGKYKSYTNIPYSGEDFVFAGIGEDIKLVDQKNWVASVGGLPYQMATIVRAEATHQVAQGNGSGNTHQIQGIACAQPASVNDPRPAPGALVISFPDGMPDDKEVLNKPSDLYFAGFMQDKNDDSDLYFSQLADYPVELGSSIDYEPTWPLQSVDPERKANNCCKLAAYDWLRRGGTGVNVNLVQGMHSTPFDNQPADKSWPPPPPVGVDADPIMIPSGIAHIYRIEPNGSISYESKPVDPIPYASVAHNQLLIECHDCIEKGAKKIKIKKVKLGPPLDVDDGQAEFTGTYDMYVRIYARKYGASSSGKHRGQTMDDPLVSYDYNPDPDKLRLIAQKNPELTKLNLLSNKKFGVASFSPQYFYGRGAKKKGAKGVASGVGKGALPILGPREDFGFALAGANNWQIDRSLGSYRTYSINSGAPAKRITYQQTGFATEIRFRRVIKAKKGLLDLIGEYGYVMVK